uniref:NAC domain-containing protein 29 n=1 Tax=Aegilops tauschii TaxID=37682 RepID=N1QY68_AEGTA
MGGSTNLPPGFHFFPSDEELVIHFLRRKAALLPCRPDIVPTLPQNRYDPWELNGKALQAGNQWYFFSQATQSRTSRNGCWNPIGADEAVSSGGSHVGLKKTLVFSIGEPFQATKTNWVMHEYHLLDGNGGTSSSGSSRKRSHKKKDHPDKECSNWVVCRVFESSYDSQVSFHEEDMELSCLDEVFLSLDDYDEQRPNGVSQMLLDHKDKKKEHGWNLCKHIAIDVINEISSKSSSNDFPIDAILEEGM